MCDNCDYNSNDIDNDDLEVCKLCFNAEPKVLITKSGAMEKYPLSKNDFNDIRHIEYKGIYTTYLYLIKDIEYLCIKKYGNKKDSDQAMIDKMKKRKDRKKYNENSKKLRRKELDDYLKSICLPGIRNDSVLCENYINHGDKSGFTKEQIGVIMNEMKFYYEKTDYTDYLYELKGEEISFRKACGGWYHWTQEDEEDVRDEAKEKALLEYIKKNCNNNHKLILEIPASLKEKADRYYAQLYKQGKIGKGIASKTVNIKSKYTFEELCSKFNDTTETYKKTQEEYTNLMKYSKVNL